MIVYLAQVFDTEDDIVFDVFHIKRERAYELMREYVTTEYPVMEYPQYYALEDGALESMEESDAPIPTVLSDGYFPDLTSFEQETSGGKEWAWGAWGEGLMRVVEVTIRED